MAHRSSYARRRVAALVVASLLVAAPSRAQSPESNVIALTQRLVLASFPQLPHEHAETLVYLDPPRFDSDWVRTSHLTLILQHHHTVPKEERDILKAEVWAAGGVLDSASFYGPYVNSPRTQALRERLTNQPELKDADVDAMLERDGASVGRDAKEPARARLLATMDRLAPALGNRILDRRIEFVSRLFGSVAVGWRGALEVEAAGKRVCYGVGFEPFDGRVTSITRMPRCPE